VQIFVLDLDQKKCAMYHNDKNLIKACLETAQILSGAIWRNGGEGPLKSGWLNHPTVIWAAQSRANYLWLVKLLKCLLVEFEIRYKHSHKYAEDADFVPNLEKLLWKMPIEKATNFPLVMPEYCKVGEDAVLSYRNYYLTDKLHLASWKNREIPQWFLED